MTPSYAGTGASYLEKDNIVRPSTSRPEAVLEDEGQRELDERLTGAYADGKVISESQESTLETTAEVFTLQSGSADQDENQALVLPEGVQGTFVLTIPHSGDGGTPDPVAAQDLDVSLATLQGAVDAVTGTANEIVLTKAAGRRVFGLTWSHANEDLTNHAQATVAVTLDDESGGGLENPPDIRADGQAPYTPPS